MAKTAIQLLNEIGRHLRLSTGSTFTSLTQDLRIGFITMMMNEAKRVVEDRWKWDALKYMVTFDSVIGTGTYVPATGGTPNERSYVTRTPIGLLNLWDVTSAQQGRLRELTRDDVEHMRIVANGTQAINNAAAVYNNGTGITVMFPNLCSSVRNYKAQIYIPQEELTTEATTVLAPWQPISLYAAARCMQERGEEFGGDPNLWFEMYTDSITTLLGTTQIRHEDMVMTRE